MFVNDPKYTDGMLFLMYRLLPLAVANNLLNQYGTVSMAECTAHATVYMAAQVCNAQNSAMMYHFLFASLTPETRNKVHIEPAIFTIMGINY
jgi:hypothetical protein